MPKRKRERLLGDDGSDDGKKRRKMDVSEICQELLDTVKSHKKEDGTLLAEPFIRAPKRRSLADYYDVVATPMDLGRIQQKVKMEEYDDVDQMSADLELLVTNAKNYYKSDSHEYQDACDLWEVYQDAKNDVLGSGGDDSCSGSIGGGGAGDVDVLSNPGSESAADDETPFEELFTSVMTATDDGRSISTMFQLLPAKNKYPDYYDVISEPIDLKMIATKIQNNVYTTLNDLEKDLLLMVKNAKNYNEPGSQIYRDANTLRRIIASKKTEIEQRKYQPIKTSERIRAKRLLPSGQKWSTITAALKYETDLDIEPMQSFASVSGIGDDTMNEELNESDPEDADTNPQWQIYEAVRNYTNYQGITLSDPFMRLPSRRFYPDYYQEIKQPMSMAKIKAKIKAGLYRDAAEVVENLNTMLENAKKYNRPDSKIFKDACKLQKVLTKKSKDFLNNQTADSSDSDNEDSQSGLIGKRVAQSTPKPRKSMSSAMTHELKKARKCQQDVDSQLKKRMKLLFRTLMDFVDETGRPLIPIFLEKPSKKDYPDYYRIIESPIDMKTIEANIKWDRYLTEEALLYDIRLMFSNCKHYNEEGSQIYRDAETLEAVLMEKLKEMGSFQPSKPKKSKSKTGNLVQQKLRSFFEAVINYVDPKGRQLSSIFMKLPSKTDYPDYYEVIKRPTDLEKIATRLKNGIYESLEDLLADLVLMFDNACKYNEPDSQIYKDALTLQHVALQTKLELAETDASGIPDVKSFLQDLLTNLFTSVYNHQDEEGRCYSDSIIEFSEQDGKSFEPNDSKPLSFDMIKRNLDKCRYRRLDRFQQDMFEVFERVRYVSRTDSQAFEDSIELQTYLIRLRNELTKNGALLQSPASNYTEAHLNVNIESLKTEKFPKEQQEAELDSESKQSDKDLDTTPLSAPGEELDEVSVGEVVYRRGDFVYIEPREKTKEPHIILIQKLIRNNTSEVWINGIWFYRPTETFHIASKRFLEREVFKSDNYNNTPLDQVVGKCYVMFVKDYFKLRPQGFEDKDVFVCESRYFTRVKTFKKIKLWPYNEFVSLVPRDIPYPMVRVPSVFKDVTEKPREEIEEEEDGAAAGVAKVLDIERPNIMCLSPDGFQSEEGAVYYEQFTIPSGSFKLGDCCYVRTDQGRNLICRVDRIWVDKEGNAFFHGPWFVQPMELPPLTPRMFYPQEVFLSSIEDTNPLLSICGKCAVLEFREYITRRPTEIAEQDIYICENKYLEHEKKFLKLSKGLVRSVVPTSLSVIDDEWYVFRKPLAILRSEYGVDKSVVVARKGQSNSETPSPLTLPRPSFETENEESNDNPPSIVSEPPVITTPVVVVKKKSTKRLVTGYIIFASEVRKSVVQANPECNFGDISRIIGTEWKNLPGDTKAEYEKKAQKQNEETAKEAAREADAAANSPAPIPGQAMENGLYECHWESKCDFQFEDSQDLLEHLTVEPHGHVWKSYADCKDKEEPIFQCLFHGCGRVKKGAPPFPSVVRLIRHCKEVHVTKQNPKCVLPDNRSKNYVGGKKSLATAAAAAAAAAASAAAAATAAAQTLPPPKPVQTTILSRTSLSPAINVSDCSASAVPPALSRATGSSNILVTSSGNIPVLSPYWADNPSAGTGVQVKPVEPLFMGAPPGPNRLLHTSTYIRYMERLRPECKHLTNWETQLNATPENTAAPDKKRLPVQWLANGSGNHGNVVNALWALRNFMLQDCLSVSRLG